MASSLRPTSISEDTTHLYSSIASRHVRTLYLLALSKNEISLLFSQEQDISERWDDLTFIHTEYSRFLIDLRTRFRLHAPEYALQLFRSKMTEQSPQYSVCLNHDYEQLQDWMNRTVYNATYGAPGNLHSEILTCYDEGVARPDRGACPQSMIRLGRLEKLRVATQRRGSEEPNRWGIRNGRDGNLRLWRYRQQMARLRHHRRQMVLPIKGSCF